MIRIVWCNTHMSGDARAAYGEGWRCHSAMTFNFEGCDPTFALLTLDTPPGETTTTNGSEDV